MGSAVVDLGTYRTRKGELVHAWYDSSGVLMAEREGPKGMERVAPSTLTSMVKLSDDPFWPEDEAPVQGVLWSE